MWGGSAGTVGTGVTEEDTAAALTISQRGRQAGTTSIRQNHYTTDAGRGRSRSSGGTG